MNTETIVAMKNICGIWDVSTRTKTSVKTNTITSTTSEYTILDVRLPLLNENNNMNSWEVLCNILDFFFV